MAEEMHDKVDEAAAKKIAEDHNFFTICDALWRKHEKTIVIRVGREFKKHGQPTPHDACISLPEALGLQEIEIALRDTRRVARELRISQN